MMASRDIHASWDYDRGVVLSTTTENGAEGEWPQRDRSAVELHSADELQLLLSNPNGPSPKEQEQTLLLELRTAKNAKREAVALLNTIYSRQQADNPALQSAASDLLQRLELLRSEIPDAGPYTVWLAIVSAGG
jgi:hypothetical protein